MRNEKLDGTAIIATQFPRTLKKAIDADDELNEKDAGVDVLGAGAALLFPNILFDDGAAAELDPAPKVKGAVVVSVALLLVAPKLNEG